MIVLTRFLSGERIAVNCDLIERVEETPDTVITLTNGTKHVVQESIDEIIEQTQLVKATVLARATRLAGDPSFGRTTRLRVVHNDDLDPPADEPSTDPDGPSR